MPAQKVTERAVRRGRVFFIGVVFGVFATEAHSATAAGALGDGQTCLAGVTIARASNALTIAGRPTQASILGEVMEIPGAGPNGAALVVKVRSRADATHLGLGAAAATGLNAAKETIAYGPDDTEALQAAVDKGAYVLLRAGAAYLARNLHWASVARADALPPAPWPVSRGSTIVSATRPGRRFT